MDINTLRSIVTVATFLVFIGIVAWAWSSRNAKGFDEAAQLPFEQDEDAQRPGTGQGRKK
ncbi:MULTISPECIES: cbb3-type cytochrome c oxidase subunit 3 [unclassified Polaromonas]|uniref:cbb3-type cytochrome oxidase subunit 3 n=1 Tax=unclassified Polaromonas TaxID=2638319 RepID=UPI001A1D4706|nr:MULTISPECIES: cbb3-type cytochrome c oxidase subunit 3 [unclassified Polaromonas]MBG6073272.1 cytochrome c oxidase cbb3-type subunit 4 [Polaromonas sp. CG_9.7]MBG6115219.1 cytochrome c oxidase cbb3-type subunit 4 [Polaromonas sp. CG_9.2]MDH6183443.1 cytochrome c oxidase cbb3-type subunit 4 [Polaromonas sp. CG_23.6]